MSHFQHLGLFLEEWFGGKVSGFPADHVELMLFVGHLGVSQRQLDV